MAKRRSKSPAGDDHRSGAAPPAGGALRRIASGGLSACADFATAGLCIAAWWAPRALPDDLTRTTALVMLIEFLSIHGLVMLPLLAILLSERWPRAGVVVASLLYLGVAMGASLALDTWWPSVFFAWLLTSRYVLPRWNLGGADEHLDIAKLWVVSTLLWLLLAFASVLVPVPALGWDASAVAELGLPGRGIWVDEPQRLLAFAASYFLLLGAFKLGSDPVPPNRDKRDRPRRAQRHS